MTNVDNTQILILSSSYLEKEFVESENDKKKKLFSFSNTYKNRICGDSTEGGLVVQNCRGG